MAAAVKMGEVDDIPVKESKDEVLINGNLDDKTNDDNDKDDVEHVEDVAEVADTPEDDTGVMEVDESVSDHEEDCTAESEPEKNDTDDKEPNEDDTGKDNLSDDDITEVQTIDSDVEDIQETIELDKTDDTDVAIDNGDNDNDNDVMIIDVKENGVASPGKSAAPAVEDNEGQLQQAGEKTKEKPSPRRSSRQQAAAQAKQMMEETKEISDESDIEEVMEEDPLAIASKKSHKAATIVVSDTKRLVEIASKTSPQNAGKKEPTLVIIDTNSILSGRGPVPVSSASNAGKGNSTANQAFSMLPMAVPAQGLYPANMRATITPIPLSNSTGKQVPALTPMVNAQAVQAAAAAAAAVAANTSILPSLTDDMFVVEAPSFIVPYVYEKPPMKDFREYINEIVAALKQERENEDKDKNTADDDDVEEIKDDDVETQKKDEEKTKPFFESPIGKFFVDIGYNLVQEYVQTDLLKQQKRKREREGGCNNETNKTIQSLLKSLEYTKENNIPYKTVLKKCEFCNYKSDSKLAMDFHLETPHMKNFVYRCNFCTYEVRSPHDILFHMEAEHCVRGRLERAPAFHQCPNCPFEDNQKGKLSRHAVTCAKKFKPDRNMEPPLDWEPPAKIPRQPRMKTPNLAMTAAMYQAMAKSTQAQFIKSHAAAAASLVQQQQQQATVQRGRGRPSLGMSSKPSKPSQKVLDIIPSVPGGSSVLVPTNFQLSGNQLYQNSSPKTKTVHQPSISITPLPRGSTSSSSNMQGGKPGDSNSKNSFVICEICDGYIKDLEQLRNHMQWIHKVKIHPKMIYNRPPLNCQKCQFRFFTDQGLERHLLGSHGLVTSSMQDSANKCKDSGRCPVCGRVYQWKLLNHVAHDHNMTLKPAHLSYKCTVCTATFGMYKQFENHVYSAHSVVAKRSVDKKGSSASPSGSGKSESLLKPLKINDEITIIPQMPKSNGAGSSSGKESSLRISVPGSSRSKLDKRDSSLSGSAIDSGEIQIINLG